MKKIYSLVIIIFLFSSLNAQTTYNKQYYPSVSGQAAPYGIIKTLDGKYMIGGVDINGTIQKWTLTKIDSSGNVLSCWKYDFFVSGPFAGECFVKQFPDSSYLAYGKA